VVAASTWPPMRLVITGPAPPAMGTYVSRIPAACMNCARLKSEGDSRSTPPTASLPGLAFAYSTKSRRVRKGLSRRTMRALGADTVHAMDRIWSSRYPASAPRRRVWMTMWGITSPPTV
jgi:hypothetical protein